MKVIEVQNLSKIYDLGQVGTGTLSKDLNRSIARLMGKPDPYATLAELNDRSIKSKTNMVYALKDIDFSVNQGEVLGIIGKNGAGKSTLLKLLSQITSPTTGSIKMKGRVASLLEVGTGMHPEMTAKENIFLNGSIMGMTRKEVKAKFDEIIDFAGVGKYVDTPIKRFSSGMKVRLGFAVAAFLEPEILIVDEVLAVGDAQFQKKAIGKMQDVSKGGGRTVLFVSHNMASIENLCTRCLILNNGNISFQGGTKSAITHYLKKENDDISSDLLKIKDRSGTGEVLFKKFYLENESDEELETLTNKNGGVLCFKLECKQNNIENVEVGFSIHDEQDVMLTHVKTSYQSFNIAKMNKGEYTLKYKIKPLPLHEGTYLIRGRISSKDCEFDWPKKPLARINVIHGDYFGTGTYKVISNSKFLIKGEWQFDCTAD